MQTKLLATMATLALLALPVAPQAQGTVRGAQEGAAQGERAAGPVGAVVGGALGAVAGTVGGILGVEERPRFRAYVVGSGCRPIGMRRTSASARCCRKKASPITRFPASTTLRATATPTSTIMRCWSIRARGASFKSSIDTQH
jgi:hypothetical protein